jgi:hypothetical protein
MGDSGASSSSEEYTSKKKSPKSTQKQIASKDVDLDDKKRKKSLDEKANNSGILLHIVLIFVSH